MSIPRLFLAALILGLAGCVQAESATPTTPDARTTATPATDSTTPTTSAATPPPTRPPWLGERALPTRPDGSVEPTRTPPELLNRSFASQDSLPAPTSSQFEFTISPLEGDPLNRSTYRDGCPVEAENLSYLQMSFWGFDGVTHTGEMIVHRDYDEQVVQVFKSLFDVRFPIEEMRLATPADLEAEPTGDTNNTSAYVCRSVTGGSRWSDHALGTALDINPFHNPYQRGELVLPELAEAYMDRSTLQPGMISDDDVVVSAFAEIGWSWGGRWSTLKDYQHFSLSGR